jgi:hypothetical protein
VLALLQIMWDRAEADGYAQHMTSHPLPDTPAHEILLDEAFGDHQVSDFAAQVEARTIGAAVHTPVLYPGRWPFGDFTFGIPPIPSYPYDGSALVVWDSGPAQVDPPPLTDTPPGTKHDPHGDPRSTPAARAQKSAFLSPGGQVVDTCGGGPCYSAGFTGP